MKRTILVAITGVLIVALGVGAIALFTSSRADAQASPNQGASFVRPAMLASGSDGINHRPGPGGMPGLGGENDTYLAEALGISVDELQAAYQTAQQAAIDQALEQGLITQEQADQMKQNGDGFFGRGFKFGGPNLKGSQIDFEALLADALGISTDELQAARQAAQEAALQASVESGDLTQEQADLIQARQALQAYIDREALTAQALGLSVDELQAARKAGTSMQDLLAEQGLTQEDFQTAYQAAYQAAVQKAVDDGVINQAQADSILSDEKDFKFGGGFPGFERGSRPGGDNFSEKPGPDGMPGLGGANDTYLSEALGISVDELQAAYQTAQQAAIDQALEQGLITQEQADQMQQNEKGFFGRGFNFGGHNPGGANIDFNALLADALGISTDELQAARQTAQEASLQAAVESGDLTQDQADLIQARQALQAYIDPQALIAQALGLSAEELQAERQAGSTMQDLLEKQGLTQAEFQSALQTAYQAAVQQAVDDGVITQAQANLILSQEKDFGPGMEFHGFDRGPRPDWGTPGGTRDFPSQPETGDGIQL